MAIWQPPSLPVARTTIAARWLVASPNSIRENVVITIQMGRVESIEDRSNQTVDVDLQDAAILPGLVNAHTHLEFSSLTNPLPRGKDFAQWIQSVIAYRSTLASKINGRSTAYSDGLKESYLNGVRFVAENCTPDWSPHDFPNWIDTVSDISGGTKSLANIKVFAFLELLGMAPSRAAERRTWAERILSDFGHFPISLAPHAPYTISWDLFTWAITAETTTSIEPIISMHLSETREELAWLANRAGPIAEMLQRFGISDEAAAPVGSTAIDFLKQLSNGKRVLVIHGNYLTDSELNFMSSHPHTFTLVYCPRTHAYFQHDRYPLEKILRYKIPLALGTDSRASNPDLSIWEEAKLVQANHPDLHAQDILAMITSIPARTFQINDSIGEIRAGMPAWVTVLPTSAKNADQVWSQMFRESGKPEPLEQWINR